MSETWNKRERERNKQQKKKEKLERREEKKSANKGSHDLESMLAYVDENGNLSSKPVDPRKRVSINSEDIEIGACPPSGNFMHLIGRANVQGKCIVRRVDGDGGEAGFAGGASDTNGDLAAIGDQQLLDLHGG